SGFNHELYKHGFNDWFYASIISENKDRFRFQRIGGTKVFYRGAGRITTNDFFHHLFENNRISDTESFMAMLRSEYGIFVDKAKATAILNNASAENFGSETEVE
ncbi:MAG: hypothetical protein FWE82_03255, partial [Defluviitaleaceae bacterium]|nr:hypothetical protein [Defluviitaleaceae bacterium]